MNYKLNTWVEFTGTWSKPSLEGGGAEGAFAFSDFSNSRGEAKAPSAPPPSNDGFDQEPKFVIHAFYENLLEPNLWLIAIKKLFFLDSSLGIISN